MSGSPHRGLHGISGILESSTAVRTEQMCIDSYQDRPAVGQDDRCYPHVLYLVSALARHNYRLESSLR